MTIAKPMQIKGRLRLPDIPQRNPDEVTAYNHLHQFGSAYHLAQHFAQQGIDPGAMLDHHRPLDPGRLCLLPRAPRGTSIC